MNRLIQLLFVLVLSSLAAPALAQTGKITGRVTEASTGDPLPGVNVVIDGTMQGATTDIDGYYTVINIRPGTYDVRASFVGFTPQVKEDVRISIDLTTEVNFDLTEETVGLEEVVVAAEREVVQRDLSASRVDVSAEQIENLPVTDITKVVGLQAGVQGLNIRGSGADQAAFMVDGLNMGTRRDNTPYTSLSLASVEEVQVQSGGFSAKYGDMRSGVVNVVTKEGLRDRYTADIIARYSPASKKYFGVAPTDPSSYWMRPFTDPEIMWEGTSAGCADDGVTGCVWSPEMRNSFPSFVGFNDIAETNGITPEQARDIFLHRHRRDLDVTNPDYVIDGGFGGPVPLLSDALGNLRFYASYRREENQYIIPLSTTGYDETNARLKLTSDIAPGMKLVLEGMTGGQSGTSEDYPREGPTRLIRDGDRQYTVGTDGLPEYNRAEDWIFGNAALSAGEINHNMLAAKFTHTLSPTSFYEVSFQRMASKYRTNPVADRDTTRSFCFDGYCVDEAPLGYSFGPSTSFENMRMGAHWGEFRDTTDITDYAGRLDYTSQLNRTNLVTAGIELNITPQDVSYGYDDFLLNPDDIFSSWNKTEIYGAAYLQDKLEFRGMVANVGVRLDYLDPNTDWWVFDETFPEAFMGKNADEMDELLEKERVSPELALSPRLGVSFPVTETSKLYFNYGHFRQRPVPEAMYQLARDFISNRVWRIANPDTPMQLTVAYELGYEQSFLDQFLVRLAGYYKDVSNQNRWVGFLSRNGLVNYTINAPDNYEDTRGVEISLFKNAGKWIQGFVNYTYMVDTGGNFGFGSYRENRVEQREYERVTRDYYQSKPLPQPFARFNLEFIVPPDFGSEVGGLNLLGDWRFSLLGEWQAGEYFTYSGRNGVPGIVNNMQWSSYKMVDMRISKSFTAGGASAMLFADINNIFNLKNFNASSFYGPNDYADYINSLHLPEEMVEGWEDQYEPKDANGAPIFGDDVPGTLGKDYINEPNGTSFQYLFPREVFFGVRFSF